MSQGDHDLLGPGQGQPELNHIRKQMDGLPAVFLILDVELGIVPEGLTLRHDLHILQVERDDTPHEAVHELPVGCMIDQVEVVVLRSLIQQ